MADKGKDKLPVEESSSSTRRHRRETAAADTQFMASARTAARTTRVPRPSMTVEEQEENDLFTAQLMSMMGTFEQLAKNPRMQKLLKTKDCRTGSQAETSQQATSRQRQVTEPVERVPTVVKGPVQHVTQAQDPARNGHRSNEQSMHPTIPMHTSFPGYFGGGSVFQSMIRPSPGFQGYMPSTGVIEGDYNVLKRGIGSTEKEKLRAFSRGLDVSIKYGVRNLKPATYEEALALAQNKELELNNGKPKQTTSTTSSQQTNGKSQANKTAMPNTPSKPKMTPDEKAKAGVIGGYFSPEEQKAYMVEQRCFGCHVKGHRKQDCAKSKERQQASTSTVAASPASKTPASLSTPSVAQLVPSLRQPQVVLDDKQEGIPTRLGLLRAYGFAKGHSFTILFGTGSEEDLISPQLATKLQCTMQPFDLDADAFTPGIRTQITQIATKVQFSVQQAPFERDLLVSPLTGCDMLIGNPWMTNHVSLIDSKSGTFFITEGVPSPVTITCDRSIPAAEKWLAELVQLEVLAFQPPIPEHYVHSLETAWSSASVQVFPLILQCESPVVERGGGCRRAINLGFCITCVNMATAVTN
ncbi:hypothetical protein L7F22_047565 [Adiantum nelumboides]|nr:hypothetical protein [Adiantum nelumboides]